MTEEFRGQLQTIYEGRNDLPKLRAKAWERFSGLKLPKDLAGLYRSSYAPASAARPVQAPEGVVVLPLTEASKTYGAFLKNRWTRSLKGESDPFVALNGALHQEGLFVYVPPGLKVEEPIRIDHPVSSSAFACSRVQIFVGAGASVDFVGMVEGDDFCFNHVWDVAVEENGRATLTTSYKNLPEAWVLDGIRATVKRDGSFRAYNVTDGGRTVRQSYHVSLIGENAETELCGAWELRETAQAQTEVVIEHVAPHCRSSQLFKGVLHDTARSSFEGKIYVHKEAQKTDAFQLNANLLLSDRATAHSKPNLEIFADDVKASHGSTTGQFDPNELFYLRTRGLTDGEAKNLLVSAFLREVTDQIPVEL